MESNLLYFEELCDKHLIGPDSFSTNIDITFKDGGSISVKKAGEFYVDKNHVVFRLLDSYKTRLIFDSNDIDDLRFCSS